MMRAGTQIGAYTVDGVIGHGGMGVVYRASQAGLGRLVALKLLSAQLSGDERFRERFRREATFQAAIEHPHIVPVYEADDSEHGLYIAMRLVPGPNLQEVIRTQDLKPARVVRILSGVAGALDTAHARGVIHRDVKPANILVVEDHAYLADFGLTKAVGVESITRSGPLLGTLDYVAPEQIRGDEVDARADIYSLGAVLFESLTGSVPFKRSTDVAVLYAHLEQDPPSVQSVRPGLPPEIDRVIRRAMAKDPADRHESAGQLMAEAAAALRVTPPPGYPGPRPNELPGDTSPLPLGDGQRDASQRGWRTRPPARLLVPAAAALFALAGLAVGLWVPGTTKALGTARVIRANAASIRVPQNWSMLPPGSPIPDLFYRGGASQVPPGVAGAKPPGRSNAGVLIGRVAAFGSNLLPGPIGNYASIDRGPTAVRLHHLEALHYSGRSNDGTRSIELYLVPTSINVVGVACYGPLGRPNGGILADCGQIAATLHLIASHSFSLGARPGYRSLLTTVLGSLASRLPGLVHALLIAPTSSAQSAAALEVSRAYRHAATQMTAPPYGAISPAEGGINVGIKHALLGLSVAFDGLATAASRRDAAAFNGASNTVRAGVTALGDSVDELAKLGYVFS